MLYDRSAGARHPAGISAGSRIPDRGDDVFYSGRGDVYDTYRRKCGNKYDADEKLWLMVFLTFILGFIVTISEPDLQVLAEQVPAVPNMVLVLSVAFGVGIFLVASLLRMLYNISLAHMLIVLYIIVFALAFLAPDEFVAVAFDSGGVTTGPMTVPFIMAFGIGISAIRSDERAEDDSFGLVALSSVGPILSVLVLSLIYRPDSAAYVPESILK